MEAFTRTSNVVLLVLAGALLPVVAGARDHATPAATEPEVTTGPRAWALATTAILTYRNGQRIDMLSPSARDDSIRKETRSILHDWWDVDNRLDLVRALESLDREGHRREFQELGRSLAAMPEARYHASLRAAGERSDVARRMQLARDYYRKRGRSSLVAWDYCRYIMLCRWGYTVGFLTEDEAWRRIMPVARTLQGGFHSWAELGEDYLVGRAYWSREETVRTGSIYRDVESRLVRDPRSAWNRLPWRMDLGAARPSPRR